VVLPGAPTPCEAELRRLAGELGVADRVVFPDWVDEADLEGLYRLAACFALPSRAEGFGLPVLEAMRRDVPVVSSRAGALPEVAGDAALLVDAEDQAALSGALRRVLTDPQTAARLRERGRARAAEQSWERTAQATLRSYERALSSR
jgi:glycosyltransferase involved in cell wall biosynthesis